MNISISKQLFIGLIVITMLCILLLLGGCRSTVTDTPSGPVANEIEIDEGPYDADYYANQYDNYFDGTGQNRGNTQSYVQPIDARWPTTNTYFNMIPEEDRWYNAANKVWTECTIIGPVHDVFQATESNGRPIFVHIGNQYPDCVSLVIWEDVWGDFSRMLSDVDSNEGSWLSVTGYLTSYNGDLQFNVDDGVSYEWWTNVN